MKRFPLPRCASTTKIVRPRESIAETQPQPALLALMDDVIEDDHEYLFKVDLPEMEKDDVKITIENGILYISGERKFEKEEKKKFHRLERFFGTFERTFTLPEDADATKIKAEFHDGVLQVHLPKHLTAKPKPIEVKVQ
jgi:HSP20 family protein